MSFPVASCSAGILYPSDFAMLQRVYRKTVTQFECGDGERRSLALYVLNMYRRGLVLEGGLLALSKRAAREKFHCKRAKRVDASLL
jgi:hypothetical protein